MPEIAAVLENSAGAGKMRVSWPKVSMFAMVFIPI
jgi:hypothetical protein